MSKMVRRFVAYRPKSVPRPGDKPAGPEPSGPAEGAPAPPARSPAQAKEIGGPSGPEPTRYGDWERNGICVDF